MVIPQELSKDAEEFRDKTPEVKQLQEEYDKYITEGSPRINAEKEEEGKQLLRENHDLIIEVLKRYMVMKEEYYKLIATWIIGCQFHKQFSSYPYMFFNAMRGSGKTRLLKLVVCLCGGILMASPTEAVLFRTTGALGIDEFENIGNKDKSSIRELLNASYKKGTKIFRLRKKKTIDGEQQVVEEFEPFRPIVMANIWGMEEVLGDRCIQLILEKSDCAIRTKLIEDYENDEIVQKIQENFKRCSLCGVVSPQNIYKKWNRYIFDKSNSTLSTFTTLLTHTTLTTPQPITPPTTPTPQENLDNIKRDSLFLKIDNSGIHGRNLELFLPLLLVGDMLGNENFKELLDISKEFVKLRSGEEQMESRDIMVFDFVSQQEGGFTYHSVKQLTNQFKQFIDYESEKEDDWCNSKWFGRALQRLCLVVDKRRLGKGVEVTLNIVKASNQLRMFRI